MRQQLRFSLTLTALLATTYCTPAWAQIEAAFAVQADPVGISVGGAGMVKVHPDQVRIDVKVEGKAELTDDALVKYRDARRRMTEALDKLKIANLKVAEKSITLASQSAQASPYAQVVINGAEAPAGGPAGIDVTGTLRVEISGLGKQSPEDILKTLGKVLDTIKDAGGSLGPTAAQTMMAARFGQSPSSATVKFLVQDFKSTREQAYKEAVADARARAERLAKLNGVKLGRVVAVHESRVSGDVADGAKPQIVAMFMGDSGETQHELDEISMDSYGEVPISVRLTVRFDIDGPESATAKPEKAATK